MKFNSLSLLAILAPAVLAKDATRTVTATSITSSPRSASPTCYADLRAGLCDYKKPDPQNLIISSMQFCMAYCEATPGCEFFIFGGGGFSRANDEAECWIYPGEEYDEEAYGDSDSCTGEPLYVQILPICYDLPAEMEYCASTTDIMWPFVIDEVCGYPPPRDDCGDDNCGPRVDAWECLDLCAEADECSYAVFDRTSNSGMGMPFDLGYCWIYNTGAFDPDAAGTCGRLTEQYVLKNPCFKVPGSSSPAPSSTASAGSSTTSSRSSTTSSASPTTSSAVSTAPAERHCQAELLAERCMYDMPDQEDLIVSDFDFCMAYCHRSSDCNYFIWTGDMTLSGVHQCWLYPGEEYDERSGSIGSCGEFVYDKPHTCEGYPAEDYCAVPADLDELVIADMVCGYPAPDDCGDNCQVTTDARKCLDLCADADECNYAVFNPSSASGLLEDSGDCWIYSNGTYDNTLVEMCGSNISQYIFKNPCITLPDPSSFAASTTAPTTASSAASSTTVSSAMSSEPAPQGSPDTAADGEGGDGENAASAAEVSMAVMLVGFAALLFM
ncbi:hypothetical protein B0I35DRAFT_447084 [Stachybotrys elegans]|uniref:Apple domain-containing protein n=1 Tax=Stachybotrys elegans TaxID=80388 RepID=A0A8K0SCZ1_9HYPO|nr:hypothetical protein B0I35DRAFT_447084 [Stachybotrys elegans]